MNEEKVDLDVFDDYPVVAGTAAGLLSERFIEKNSGHRLLCRECGEFRRTRAELIASPAALRITCKSCGAYSDFVPVAGELMPAAFAKRVRRFTFARFMEVLREANASSSERV